MREKGKVSEVYERERGRERCRLAGAVKGRQRIKRSSEAEMGFGADVEYHNRISSPANEGPCLSVSVISVLAVPFDFISRCIFPLSES